MLTGNNIIYIGKKNSQDFDPDQLIQFTPSEKADDTIRYGYRNYDVDRTIDFENGVLSQIVSITPQGFRSEPLSNAEAAALLAHFGFDWKVPYSVRKKLHPYNPFVGETRFYSQPVAAISCVS